MDRVWPLFVLLPGLPPVACHHPGGRRRKRRKTPRKANDTGWCSLRQNNEQKYSYCMAENNMFFCVPGIPPESPNTGMKQGEGEKRKHVFDVACLCHIMAFTKKFQVDMVACLHVVSTRSSLRLKRKRKDERKHKKRSVFFLLWIIAATQPQFSCGVELPSCLGPDGWRQHCDRCCCFYTQSKAEQSRAKRGEEMKREIKKERGSESSR